LKIDVERLENHQVKLTVEVDASSLDSAKQRAARRISKNTKIPGFRPGKAPYNVILRHIGEEAILEEAIELMVKDIYPKALDEAKIDPYGPGSLENFKNEKAPVFEFIVPLRAQVELGEYLNIRLPYELSEVPEDEVDKLLNSLREQNAVIEPADRPAQDGDLVYMKLSAQKLNPKDDEDAKLIEERSLPVNVLKEEDETRMEWPFSGFSRRLLGLSAGERTTFEYTYPEEAAFSAFKGVQASFDIEVESVKSRVLPDLDDEFAQSVGDFATMDELRAQLRKNLEEQNALDYNQEYDEQVLDQVVASSTISYPPQMLEHEIGHVIEHLNERLERQGMSKELYLKSRQMDEAALHEEARPVAETRLKRSLTLLNLAEKMKIEVSQEDLHAETNRTLEGFARMMSEKDFRKYVSSKDNASGLVENVMMDLVIERTQERLRAIARGMEVESTETAPAAEEDNKVETETTPVLEQTEEHKTGK
jgi:trigger factor